MNNLSDNIINNKIIFYSALIAIVFHASLIPISSMIKLNKIEEIEPKIILELINDIKEITPIVNNIIPPEVSQPREVLKPPNIENLKDIKIEPIENLTKPVFLSEDIILPDNLKPLINNKIDVPKKINTLNNEVSIDDLPEIIKPEQIKINNKPIETLNKPDINNDISFDSPPEVIKPEQIKISNEPIEALNKPDFNINYKSIEIIKLDEKITSQNINLPNKPIKQDIITKEEQIDKINKNITDDSKLSVDQISSLKIYKNKIRFIIQSFAISNYPKKDLRRKNEGIVHIVFKLKVDGNIDYINTGPNTNASQSLIEAALDSVRKSAPFESIKLLEKQNEFEINIIYKIN